MALNVSTRSAELSFPEPPAETGDSSRKAKLKSKSRSSQDVATAPGKRRATKSRNKRADGKQKATATLSSKTTRARRVAPKSPPSTDSSTMRDPVRVYLREMGQVSLLTREGEVEIAKRIEAALHDRELAVLGTPFGIRAVLENAEQLKQGDLVLKKVIDGLDAPEVLVTPEQRRRQFFTKITRVRRLEVEVAKKLPSIANSRTSEDTRKRLRGEVAELYAEMVEHLRATKFAKRQVATIIGNYRSLGPMIFRAQSDSRKVTKSYGLRPVEYREAAVLAGQIGRAHV